jgi:enolase
MIIHKISAEMISDSRGDKTIKISINTNVGNFFASAPNGKSRGKNEAEPYKKSLKEDIKIIRKFSDYFSEDNLEDFEDLRRIEDIVEGHIGANTLFALESASLKAIAKEQKKEIWQIINKENKIKLPRLVGNCIGGGKHSETLKEKRPDFQEFLLIPKEKSIEKNFEKNKKIKQIVKNDLIEKDKYFENKENDERAWQTSLNEKEILDILKNKKVSLGIDIAASSFYKRKNYNYKNPLLKRDDGEQLNYLSNLIKNYNLFYIEDPFYEEDFESYSKLLKKFPKSLIVGDDLTVTNSKRFDKAIKLKSINAIIVKPNQCGSLLEVKKVCDIAKKNNIKIIFSHRSGETEEHILADLAFGFQADFFKCGIDGKEREVKLKRLIEIKRSFM